VAAKCGVSSLLSPSTTAKTLGSPAGTLKTTTSDSCLWTIEGNRTDYTSGISIKVNSLVGLSVSIFNGVTYAKSLLIAENIISTYTRTFPLINKTYILATPLPTNLKTAVFNLSYTLVNKVYSNLTALDARPWIPTYYVT